MKNQTAHLTELYFKAFNNKKYADMLELLGEDVAHEINQGQIQIGREAFKKFLKHMEDCYDETLEEMKILSASESNVAAAEYFVRGTYLKTDGSLPQARGQKYRIRAGSFLEVKDGKICRVTTYYNLPAWIEAVQK